MWAVKVRRGSAVGTGAALSASLVLTCEHVIAGSGALQVRLASGVWERAEVVDADKRLDVAVLELTGTANLDVRSVLVPRALWRGAAPLQTVAELCTDDPQTPRSPSLRIARAHRDATRVQFEVVDDRQGVWEGHSGGPVVEQVDSLAQPRIVGVVRAVDEFSRDAFDKAGVGWMVPMERVAERFDAVRSLLEAPVERDGAWRTHWLPRSRGVAGDGDEGYFFSGRTRAYAHLCEHLRAGAGLLVVTGERGHGKSALLARAVTLSCARYRTLLKDDRRLLGVSDGSNVIALDAVVFARGKHTNAVAQEIALQLGYGDVDAQSLLSSCADDVQAGRAPSIVVDAVDEGAAVHELVSQVIVPLADAGARLAIGALRRRVAPLRARRLLWLDLDAEPQGNEDVEQYVRRRLSAGTYDAATASIVAAKVARRAQRNFVYAELVARKLAAAAPIDARVGGWQDQIPTDVSEAFWAYLDRFGEQREHVLDRLHPLARARGDGLAVDPPDTWLQAARALRPDARRPINADELCAVAEDADDYLVVSAASGALRLYHEGLADAIVRLCAEQRLTATRQDPCDAAIEREMRDAARRMTDALVALLPDPAAPAEAYASMDPYLRAHVAAHLAEAGRAGELLDRPGLLLSADEDDLRRALVRGAVNVPAFSQPARVAVVHALTRQSASLDRRAAKLHAALRRQGEDTRADALNAARGCAPPLPYELISAPRLASFVATIPDAHASVTTALAAISHDGAPLIISASDAGELRSCRIDGTPGALHVDHAHSNRITALAVVEHEGAPLIISADVDGALRSCRIDGTPGALHVEHAHSTRITALAVLEHDGAPLIISADYHWVLRTWHIDGTTGALRVEDAPSHGYAMQFIDCRALAVLEHDGAPLIISARDEGLLRSWRIDGTPGALHIDDTHSRGITAMAVVEHEAAPLIISAGCDGELRSWRSDGTPGALYVDDAHSSEIVALVVVEHEGAPLIISASRDGELRSWRSDGTPGALHVDDAHSRGIVALVVVEDEGAPLIISAGYDWVLRSWRADATPSALHVDDASCGAIWPSLAVLEHEGAPLLISAGFDRALRSCRIDRTRGALHIDDAHSREISALAVLEHDGAPLLISASDDGALRSWRIDGSPGELHVDDAHSRGIGALAVLEHDGAPLLISASRDDGALRSWRTDGTPGALHIDDAYSDGIRALAVVEHEGAPLIISASRHWMLRSWRIDGTPGTLHIDNSKSHHRALAVFGRNRALAVLEHDGAQLIISADPRALRSWRTDGTPGALHIDADDTRGMITALALVEHDGAPLIISGGELGALRSWRIDGTPGELHIDDAHSDWISALAVVEHDGTPLIISAGEHDRTIIASRITAARLSAPPW